MPTYVGQWKAFQDTKTITFTPVTGTAVTDAKGLIRSPSRRQNWTNDGFGDDTVDAVWTVFADTIPLITDVKPDDQITFGSDLYIVNSVTNRIEIGEWECRCVKKQS